MSKVNAWETPDGQAAIAVLVEAEILKKYGYSPCWRCPCHLRDAARVFLLRTGEIGDRNNTHWYIHSATLEDGRDIEIMRADPDERDIAAVLAVGKDGP